MTHKNKQSRHGWGIGVLALIVVAGCANDPTRRTPCDGPLSPINAGQVTVDEKPGDLR